MKSYSENQQYQARNADIVDFLARTEGFTFNREGKGYRCVQHDSLVVYPDRKGFYWNSKHIGGANAVDWCMTVKNETFPQAMERIVGKPEGNYQKPAQKSATNFTSKPDNKIQQATPEKPPLIEQKQPFVLPEKAPNNNRAVAYLCTTRKIDYKIVQDLIKQNKLYQDFRGNAVFVGFNGENPAYAFKRTTQTIGEYKGWRGEETSSKKEFSFRMDGTDKTKVYVFESPIDALSHASIINEAFQNPEMHKMHTRLALGGVSDNALAEFAKNNPDLKEIIFALDNDETGRNATVKLAEKYENMGYSVRMVKPKNKDFNEDLCQKRTQKNTAETSQKQSNKAPAMA